MSSAQNLERDMFWLPASPNLIPNWGPGTPLDTPIIQTDGNVYVKHGHGQVIAEASEGSDYFHVGLTMKGPTEGNTAYRLFMNNQSATSWIGCVLHDTAGDTVTGTPLLIARSGQFDGIVCLRSSLITETDLVTFYMAVVAANSTQACMSVQRLAAKPDGYISAVA